MTNYSNEMRLLVAEDRTRRARKTSVYEKKISTQELMSRCTKYVVGIALLGLVALGVNNCSSDLEKAVAAGVTVSNEMDRTYR